MVGRDIGAVYGGAAEHADRSNAPSVLEVEQPRRAARGARRLVRGAAAARFSASAASSAPAGPRRPRRSSACGRATGGTVRLNGRELNIRSPTDAVRAGLGFVPEDRRVQNIVPDLSVRENLLLGHLARASRLLARLPAAAGEDRRAAARSSSCPPHRLLDANMLNFSGGMQQKIVIARWLLLEPACLILDEPTKGVDIGTRQSIYALLRRIAGQGTAVVVIASDFEELIGISTRITVISDGRSIADLAGGMLDEEKLTLLAAPRTSMTRNTQLLERLARELGGAALLGADRGRPRDLPQQPPSPNPAASPGFAAGDVLPLAATARYPDRAGAPRGRLRGRGGRQPLDARPADPQSPRPRARLDRGHGARRAAGRDQVDDRDKGSRLFMVEQATAATGGRGEGTRQRSSACGVDRGQPRAADAGAGAGDRGRAVGRCRPIS